MPSNPKCRPSHYISEKCSLFNISHKTRFLLKRKYHIFISLFLNICTQYMFYILMSCKTIEESTSCYKIPFIYKLPQTLLGAFEKSSFFCKIWEFSKMVILGSTLTRGWGPLRLKHVMPIGILDILWNGINWILKISVKKHSFV